MPILTEPFNTYTARPSCSKTQTAAPSPSTAHLSPHEATADEPNRPNTHFWPASIKIALARLAAPNGGYPRLLTWAFET